MKKTKLFKSLLVAAGLLAGSASAWAADATSIYERGTTKAWSDADLTDWTNNYASSFEINNGLAIAGGNGDNYVTKSITTKDNSKLYFTATWNTGSSTGNAGNYNFLKFGDVEMQAWGQAQNSVIVIGGVSTTLASNKDDVRGNVSWTVSVTIDKAKGTVDYEITLPKSGKKTGSGTLASTDFSSISFGFHKGGRTNANNSTLTAIEIKEEEQTVTTANYTIKYLCGETVVKDEATRIGVVGEAITLTDADKSSVIKDGNKYVYSNDDSDGKTITAEGTVVTVNFTEAAKYAYTLNAVDANNNILKELGTGEQFEGESATVYFNKAINVNGKWYITDYTGNWVFHEAKTENILFKEDAGLTYFFEVEDINTSRSWAATGAYPDRYSNGKAGRLYSGAYAYTDALEGGIYSVTLWGRNQASSSEAAIGIYVRDAEGNETKCTNQFEKWGTGNQGTKTIIIKIPDGYGLELKNENADYNSNLEMDYLILRKFDSMTIVGFTTEADLTDADKWEPTNGIAMTPSEEDPAIWTAVVEDYVIDGNGDAGLKYYYKAVANGAYGIYELPASGNMDYNFNYDGAGAGMYKLTFTANISANTVELAIEKQKQSFTVSYVNTEKKATLYAYTFNAEELGGWPGTEMTKSTEQVNGFDVYTITFEAYNAPGKIIFTDNAGWQTDNLDFVNNSQYGIEWPKVNITIAGYATYCSPYALDFSEVEGLKAYVAKINGSNVTFEEVATAPAKTGLLLKAAQGEYTVKPIATATATESALTGVLEDTPCDAGIFVLMNGEKGVGFYNTTKEFTVGANTAYIPAQTGSGSRNFIALNFGDNTTTAIEGVATVTMESDAVFNLQGQRVNAAKKGLYIVNGKKMILK